MPSDDELIARGTQAMAADPWPPGYSASDAGIFYSNTGQATDDGQPVKLKTVRICDRFKVVAKTADDAHENCGLLLSWQDREGHPHTRIISEKQLHMDGCFIAQELAQAGLKVEAAKGAHDKLKYLLNEFRPTQRRRCVTRSGWHMTDKGLSFILPSGEVFGPGCEDIALLHKNNDTVEAMRPHGELKEWCDHVARYAVNNHRLGLFICAAFTPPILNVLREGTSPSYARFLAGQHETT